MQISFFVDERRRPPETLLRDWYSLEDVAAAVASAGVRVTVVQASLSPGAITRRGVEFVFIEPEPSSRSLALSKAFRSLVRERAPDVFHVHGLGFAPAVLALRELAPHVPILLQDHASGPPGFWHRATWRRGAAAAAGISFCARAQAQPFVQRGLLPPDVRVFEIPESTSTFMPGDAAAARVETGLHGDPSLLWVGTLDRNKDPLTVLEGVAAAVPYLPGLQLWCCFGSAPLLSDVQSRIDRDAALRDRVHLLGRVPHEQIETLMRAADLFVLGSHREGSCFSLIEALATGLTPVVTDIPSLRVLSGNGAVGVLWPCGDSHALGLALRSAAAALQSRTRTEVRAHFDEHLSSVAIGKKFAAAYRELIPARARALAAAGPVQCGDRPP
jgi:glycosyltransferase involved in cell wall biosynthesis